MLNPYEQEFPPLERRVDQNTKVPSKPYIVPNIVDAQGNYQSSQAEEVLNWQTQNAVSQNIALRRIDYKLDSLTTKTDGLAYQIDQIFEEVKNLYLHHRQQAQKLDAELKTFIKRGYMGSQFKQKEIELQVIQQDLKRIELDMTKKQSQVIYEPYPSFSTIPAPLFLSSPISYLEEADYTEFVDISRIATVQPGEEEEFDQSFVEQLDDDLPRQDHNYKPTSGPWLTFDDIPYGKWRFPLQEVNAWIDL
ncbi:hypothetical protein K1719_021674 [Acacia pycnantha]|nr:hypothetical protein K1719_021674 [Acacia pycnantha]